MTPGDLRIPLLRARYADGSLTPVELAADLLRRISARGDDGTWITISDRLMDDARALDPADRDRLPLWGVPFAVKDNIDVAGLPTTAGCPGFAYEPKTSAPVVDELLAVGALLVGKTNLDQFATGLNGTRSPYGIPSSVADPALISGGSSSGSAIAVAAGLASFALATDTAGSGRVPAALNGVVGLKPSRGLLSSNGLVPACRSLDCISVMATTVEDATLVNALLAGYDEDDPWSRRLPLPAPLPEFRSLNGVVFAVPDSIGEWGSRGEKEAWSSLCAVLVAHGATLLPVDFAPLLEAGAQLYGGAWLAERAQGLEPFLTEQAREVLPVIHEVLVGAEQIDAGAVFAAYDKMFALRREVERILDRADALLTPTVRTTFTIEEMLTEPVTRNTALGTYTTFTNLLDLCAIVVPAGVTSAGVPVGLQLQMLAGEDDDLAGLARAVQDAVRPSGWMEIAVVGAHLEGMPLHGDLVSRGAVLQRRTTTAPVYRLYALAGGPPYRPGLARVARGGKPIEVEVYRVPVDNVGGFLATVPPPLAIGTVVLEDETEVHGFVCEPIALAGATDITSYGGWRRYMSSRA